MTAGSANPHIAVSRPWFKKKRFVIPLGVVALLFIGGIASGSDSDSDDTSDANTALSADESATGAETEPPAAVVETEAPEPEKPALTSGQENAIRAAENYLDYTAFSRKGLIDQLKFEEYSEKDAIFAVDAIKPNWNEQAAAAAEKYLEFTAFSRGGLISQLEFDGFTTAQATYGADKAGV